MQITRTAIVLPEFSFVSKNKIHALETEADELIFILAWKQFEECYAQNIKPGLVLYSLQKQLIAICDKPFYLFPIDASTTMPHQLAMRISHFCPSFQRVISNDSILLQAIKMVLHCRTELFDFELLQILKEANNIRRGLFVARAQPFHNGHAEIIDKILLENDEAIIIIGCAEASFTKENPATAGERMSIIKTYINGKHPGKCLLVPIPYNRFIAENFKELSFLLPEYQTVYATNTYALEMAKHEAYSTVNPTIKATARGRYIREKICNNENIENDMPSEAYRELKNIGIDARIKALHEQKNETQCAE